MGGREGGVKSGVDMIRFTVSKIQLLNRDGIMEKKA